MKSSKRLEQQATNLIKQSELKKKRVKSKRYKEQIVLPKEVKVLGEYVAMVDLHKEVKKEVKFVVIAD